jgi:hypothetical protein
MTNSSSRLRAGGVNVGSGMESSSTLTAKSAVGGKRGHRDVIAREFAVFKITLEQMQG